MPSHWVSVLLALRAAVGCTGECHNSSQCADGPQDDADHSLLQARLDQGPYGKPRRSPPHWEDQLPYGKPPRSSSPQAEEHFVQLDGFTKTPIRRQVMKRSFVRELMISYPLDKNPIKVTGKTAYIPFSSILEGEYSRNSATQDQDDYGVEKAMAFLGNAASMLSDRVRLAFAEKSHTYYVRGDMPRMTEDKLQRVRAQQSRGLQNRAIEARDERLSATAGLASYIGTQIVVGGKDLNHVERLRKHVAFNEGAMASHDWAVVRKMEAELKSRRNSVTTTRPYRSSIGCLHLENADLMNFTEDGVELPLERKMVAYRGRLASAPNEEYQMSTGFAIFSYNDASNSLDIFFGFSSVVEIMDGAKSPVAAFSVGPADGHALPVVPEGREASMLPEWLEPPLAAMGRAAGILTKVIPPDFTLLHSTRDELGCSDTVLGSVKERSAGLQKMLGMMGDLKSTSALDLFSVLPSTTEAYQSAMTWCFCAVEYLRPEDKDAVALLSPLMLMGFLHVLSELNTDAVAAVVYSHTLWNTVNETLLNP